MIEPSPPNGTDGILFVASANHDKRYDAGKLSAVTLSALGLPAFTTSLPATPPAPVRIENLQMGVRSELYIDSFAGEMDVLDLGGGVQRFFIPSHAEFDRLVVVDAVGAELDCFSIAGTGDDDRECLNVSPSLSRFSAERVEGYQRGKPSAPAPISVDVRDGEVYVVHQESAVSPPGTGQNAEAYLVKLSGADPQVTPDAYISIADGQDGRFEGVSSGIAVGSRYVFVSGRGATLAETVRLVDRTTRAVRLPGVQSGYTVLEARGLALTDDESTLYVAGRFPDTLLQVALAGAAGPEPKLSVVRAVPLPPGASQVAVISRPGRGNLVFVSCATANLISVYDEDVGKIVREYTGVGSAPYGMVFQRNGGGARLFVSSFGSGSVAVVDIPDLVTPDYLVVAHIGQTHECTLSEGASGCGQ